MLFTPEPEKKSCKNARILYQMKTLLMFLAETNVITNIVKRELEKNEGYEELLCDIINACIKYYEEMLYLIPDEKHMLLKVIGFSLSLMPTDPNGSNIYKLHSKNKLPLQKIDRFFREIQVVTLYGDMQIPLSTYIHGMADYNKNSNKAFKWTCIDESTYTNDATPPSSPNYDLSRRVHLIRQEHVKFISELSHKNNRYQIVSAGTVGTDESTSDNWRGFY